MAGRKKSGGGSDIAFVVGRAGLAGAAFGARSFLVLGFGLLDGCVAADRRRQCVEGNAFEISARAVDGGDDAARSLPVLAIGAVAVVAVARIARSSIRAIVALEAFAAAIRPLVVALVVALVLL